MTMKITHSMTINDYEFTPSMAIVMIFEITNSMTFNDYDFTRSMTITDL